MSSTMGVQIGGGTIIDIAPIDGGPNQEYQWSFSASVNGQSGVVVFWAQTADADKASGIALQILNYDPNNLQPPGSTDGSPPPDGGDGEDGRDGSDGDDDGASDDGTSGSGGEVGDSV